jgi:hypothetical protein
MKYIERDIYVPSYPFSPIQEYSIRLMDICEEKNICREGHRMLSKLINELIADIRIGNVEVGKSLKKGTNCQLHFFR